MNTNCEICDCPEGWEASVKDHDAGCSCEECTSHCWGGIQCTSRVVDWRARALEAEATLAAERGDPKGAVDDWVHGTQLDVLGGGWFRILAWGRSGKRKGMPSAWLWVDTGLGAFVEDKYMPTAYGLTDTRKHRREHNPHEISEWWTHAIGPREAMKAADARLARETALDEGPLSD